MARLLVSFQGAEFAFDLRGDAVRIGSAPTNGLVLRDPGVSQEHARQADDELTEADTHDGLLHDVGTRAVVAGHVGRDNRTHNQASRDDGRALTDRHGGPRRR